MPLPTDFATLNRIRDALARCFDASRMWSSARRRSTGWQRQGSRPTKRCSRC